MGKIKICGVRSVEDARMVSCKTVDAVGVLVGQMHRSDDFVSPALARTIFAALPPFCAGVLVTHLARVSDLAALLDATAASTAQLHGEVSVEDCHLLRAGYPHVKLLKSVHVTDESSLGVAASYAGVVDAILLDTSNPATGQVGGTGRVHDWNLSAAIVAASQVPVILAGGLHPDNVGDAILKVRPFGVDVNSGVKDALGFKDRLKVGRFAISARLGFAML